MMKDIKNAKLMLMNYMFYELAEKLNLINS